MRTKPDFKTNTHSPRMLSHLIAFFCMSAVILTGIQVPVQAQEVQYERPAWQFGLVGGANQSYYQGTTQNLNASTFAPQAFGHGNGTGLFIASTIEYHRPNSVFGFMLQTGFDSRKGAFDDVTTKCCPSPSNLSTELSYLTLEPSLRIAPFRSNFFLFAGPRLAFELNKSFEFDIGINPETQEESRVRNETGDFSDVDNTQFSMLVGAGLDIPVSSMTSRTQYAISPFITFQPYYGQTPRSIETWNLTTFRTGVSLKFGKGKRVNTAAPISTPVAAIALVPPVTFTVISPVNEPVAVSFIETFPLRNYVFFDEGSTSIPGRYVVLNKEQASNFTEEHLGSFNQVTATERSSRQMTAYYNVLNILGERMVENPAATITLAGSSKQEVQEAKQRAESVKLYLVTAFGISASRIATEGNLKPGIPSTQDRSTRELEFLSQEDNRVTIASDSTVLLKEFQTGSDARRKSTVPEQDAPLDSYVTFNADGASKAFKSWKLELRDENGKLQSFGPYTKDKVSLSGKSILGDHASGNYTINMIGDAKNGSTVREEAEAEIVLWVPPVEEHGKRYSVIYEFNNSETSAIYKKYLLDVVTPAIPAGATVKILGYSDSIGDISYNRMLSETRAADVRAIIQSGLTKAGRTDVMFEVEGHGEVLSESQFNNTLPEQRFYNRTVLIDIAPANK